jgi:diacylglycerol kinase (ATP)
LKATIIANPIAGRHVAKRDLHAALEVLEHSGWKLELHFSSGVGDATLLARRAVETGSEAVLAAGGDGTLNEVVQALAGTNVALGYLPFGTVNIWARELKIPLDGAGAARAIASGRVEQFDLGIVNDRYFLLMAGIGFDGEVVKRAHGLERYKERFGVLPYIAAGLMAVPLYRGVDAELRYDGLIRRVQALMLVVGNTRLYGGHFHLTPNAVANDGWLDLTVVKGRGPLSLLRQALPLIVARSVRGADVETHRVQELTVQTPEPVLLQVDGEVVGCTPARFSVAPRALRAIVPRDFRSDLLKES